MSKMIGWNIWMAECLRHAVMFNNYGKHPFRFSHTFKEYPLYPHYDEGCKYIDVVGKQNTKDSIKDSVVIEVKSGWSDFCSGHGLNLYGNWNFIAVEEGQFSKDLLYYMCKNHDDWNSIGLLEVTNNGSVETLLPAEGLYNRIMPGLYHIENHWEDAKDCTDNDGSIENWFQTEILPMLKADDDTRKTNRKEYPVEHLSFDKDEYWWLKIQTSEFLRQDILGYNFAV